jgi:hypothetical protein
MIGPPGLSGTVGGEEEEAAEGWNRECTRMHANAAGERPWGKCQRRSGGNGEENRPPIRLRPGYAGQVPADLSAIASSRRRMDTDATDETWGCGVKGQEETAKRLGRNTARNERQRNNRRMGAWLREAAAATSALSPIQRPLLRAVVCCVHCCVHVAAESSCCFRCPRNKRGLSPALRTRRE